MKVAELEFLFGSNSLRAGPFSLLRTLSLRADPPYTRSYGQGSCYGVSYHDRNRHG